MDDDLIVRPEKPDPAMQDLVTEAAAFWKETGRTLVRQSISSIDDTAKHILSVAGILIGLYFNAIAFGDLRGAIDDPVQVAIYLAPIALLIASVTAALWVFLRSQYSLNILSSGGAKQVYEEVLRRKMRALRIGSICLVLGIVAVLIAVFRYIRG
jgi:hypothetical protein